MSQKVLIIDDDFSIHAIIIARLGNYRLEFVSAYDGESGLLLAAERKPDLILLDLDMPQMDGYEVCRRLKAEAVTQGIPILFLTAKGSVDHRIRGLDLGAMDYITKPFDPSELRARIGVGLRNKHRIDVLSDKAMIDELTGLSNRAYFDRRLDSDLATSRRSGRPLACIRIALDGAKSIQDRYGVAAVEHALRTVAAGLQETCRKEDVLCRFGPDEFAILACDADTESVEKFVERLRSSVEQMTRVSDDAAIRITCSFGVAVSRFSFGRSVVHGAGAALYHARQAGGNCIDAGPELTELRVAV